MKNCNACPIAGTVLPFASLTWIALASLLQGFLEFPRHVSAFRLYLPGAPPQSPRLSYLRALSLKGTAHACRRGVAPGNALQKNERFQGRHPFFYRWLLMHMLAWRGKDFPFAVELRHLLHQHV
ncbi:hypothetical protein, partial [Nitrosospira multiformis]|uniref:hypothetical protein n=1 Tax=Nitrosospira multiformis TaxID=1231 RepID=UPI001C630782